jgi:hypothetical protein
MKISARPRGAPVFPLTAAALLAAVALAALATAATLLGLLVFAGIALPAVWSARAARRKAAAGVLRQLLDALTSRKQH